VDILIEPEGPKTKSNGEHPEISKELNIKRANKNNGNTLRVKNIIFLFILNLLSYFILTIKIIRFESSFLSGALNLFNF